jgi:hypothetical protein
MVFMTKPEHVFWEDLFLGVHFNNLTMGQYLLEIENFKIFGNLEISSKTNVLVA